MLTQPILSEVSPLDDRYRYPGKDMPAVYFVSIPNRFESPSSMSTEKLMMQCGLNTGNLLFTNAVMRQLKFGHHESGFHFDPDYVNDRFDCVVIPAANWLNERYDSFSELASAVERLTVPVIIIGLGAQASWEQQIPKVPAETLRLVRAIAERSVSLGVRGEFTCEVLHHYGITNVDVIGCPSLFWHGSHPSVVKNSVLCGRPVLGATGYAGSRFDDARATAHQLCQRELYRLAFREKIDFVYQSERPEIDILLSGKHSIDETLKETVVWYYDAKDFDQWMDFVLSCGHSFFDAESWINEMRSFDFYLGSRLHGAIAALLAGTPAALIVHDSRTRELARFAAIPTIQLADVRTHSRNLLQSVVEKFDCDAWQRKYILNLSGYARFLERNGVLHRLFDFS